jgi:hypothetical protein
MFIRLLLLILPAFALKAQVIIPPYGPAFPQQEVPLIYITIDPDSLEAVLDPQNFHTEREFPAKFRFVSSSSTIEFPLIGFRLRGNTSVNAAKKSFKVSFNTYEDLKWNGLEKLNLNGNANDPSMMRAKLCWDALREAGLPGSRTSFVKLYINGEYRGLYTQTEHFDEEFTQLYFDRKGSGSLYKCLYPATLEYLGNSQEPYKAFSGNRQFYELHTTDWADDYSDLVNFIRILNETPLSSLPCELESVFDVDRYLQYAAFDILTGNWDGYIFNKNNFYLYHDKNTGLMEYMVYDLDNTLGIDWINQDWENRNIYQWGPSSENRPLYKRLMQIPKYKDRFTWYLRQWAAGPLKPEQIETNAQKWLQLIRNAAQEDQYRPLDFGFSFSQFENAATEAAGGHVKSGILPFLDARIGSAVEQAEEGTIPAISFRGGWLDPPLREGRIYASTPVIPGMEVNWEYHTGGENWLPGSSLRDDGMGADFRAADGNWVGAFDIPADPDSVFYRLRASLQGNELLWPCAGKLIYLSAWSQSPLVINELMSRNNGFIMDEKGSFSDWVEIWNKSNTPINLGNYFLSDDSQEPDQWPLPVIQLQAGDFKLFWCDSDEDFNRNHVNFGLSAEGEGVSLYVKRNETLQQADFVEFPSLAADISYGRLTDGADAWVKFSSPTPEGSNSAASLSEGATTPYLKIYPNPGLTIAHFNREVRQVMIYDQSGRLVFKDEKISYLDTGHLSPGFYMIHADGQWLRWICKP